MKRMFLCMAAAFFLFLVLPCQRADAENEPHYLWLPYCVNDAEWWTGLHIKTEDFTDTIQVYFSGDTTYAWPAVVELDSRGRWTGYVQNLLDDPEDFQTQSLLHIRSTKARFTVTQFVGNAGGGFGFQTFHAAPGTWIASGWPHKAAPAEE